MARILCLDYGLKRVGVAVTDELKIIASPLETIRTSEVISFINSYTKAVSYTHLTLPTKA